MLSFARQLCRVYCTRTDTVVHYVHINGLLYYPGSYEFAGKYMQCDKDLDLRIDHNSEKASRRIHSTSALHGDRKYVFSIAPDKPSASTQSL